MLMLMLMLRRVQQTTDADVGFRSRVSRSSFVRSFVNLQIFAGGSVGTSRLGLRRAIKSCRRELPERGSASSDGRASEEGSFRMQDRRWTRSWAASLSLGGGRGRVRRQQPAAASISWHQQVEQACVRACVRACIHPSIPLNWGRRHVFFRGRCARGMASWLATCSSARSTSGKGAAAGCFCTVKPSCRLRKRAMWGSGNELVTGLVCLPVSGTVETGCRWAHPILVRLAWRRHGRDACCSPMFASFPSVPAHLGGRSGPRRGQGCV